MNNYITINGKLINKKDISFNTDSFKIIYNKDTNEWECYYNNELTDSCKSLYHLLGDYIPKL